MTRIGLTQRVDVVNAYGERRDCLDQNWANLLISMGYWPIPLANGVADVGGYVATLGLDGVILTGGNDLCDAGGATDVADERDRFEHLLLEVCADRLLPVLGICRGLQMLNVHYGGSVSPVSQHVSQHHMVNLDPLYFSGSTTADEVNSFHGFGIGDRDQSRQLKAIAWTTDGTIEGLSHKTLPQLGVMWHPEREEPFAQRDLMLIRGIFGGEMACEP